LGAPDDNAWMPDGNTTFDFLTVGFAEAEEATGLLIRQTSGGSIHRVDLVDDGGTYHTIWTGSDPTSGVVDFVLSFDETAYDVSGARIFVTGGYAGIDAVRLLTDGSATELTLSGRGFDGGYYQDITYDEDGHPLLSLMSLRGVLLQTQEREYDGEGRLDSVLITDSLSNQTYITYDDSGNVLTQTLAYGTLEPATTTNEYDDDGNLISLIDPVGNETTWGYEDGLEVSMTDPLLETEYRTYDAAGRLTSLLNRNDKLMTFEYDGQGRLITETWYDGPTDEDDVVELRTWTYTPEGRVATATNDLGTYAFQYNDSGRVIHVDEPFGVSLTFAYDEMGNRILVRDSFGTVEESTYDVYGNLVTRILTQGEYELRIDQTFDDVGRVLTKARYSDAAGTVLVGASLYEYDLDGRLTSLIHYDSEDEELAVYGYVYDTEGRLIAKTDHGVTTVYVYDAQDQLIEAGEDEYDYDANGNREMEGYETGDANRIEADGTWSYQHDAEGNMVKRTKGEEAETWTYGYNHRRQMIWAEKRATDGGTLLIRSDYGYDVFGNRIVKSVTIGETTTTQHFAQDGWNPAKPTPIGNENFDVWADLDAENELQVRYLCGDVVDEIVARVDDNGPAWLLTDYQGSVRDVTDDEGDVIASRDYEAFGLISAESGGEWFGRYGNAGREWDAELRMYHNRRREFDPLTGLFTSEDPLGLTPDTNPYRYVGNMPTTATDPSGLIGIFLEGTGYNQFSGTVMRQLFEAYQKKKKNNDAHYATTTVGNLEDVVNTAHQKVRLAFMNNDKIVDLFGYSRGGAAAIALVRRINNDPQLKGITIRAVGLIDPCVPIPHGEDLNVFKELFPRTDPKKVDDILDFDQLPNGIVNLQIWHRQIKLDKDNKPIEPMLFQNHFFVPQAVSLLQGPRSKDIATEYDHFSVGTRREVAEMISDWLNSISNEFAPLNDVAYKDGRDKPSKAMSVIVAVTTAVDLFANREIANKSFAKAEAHDFSGLMNEYRKQQK
jgi:RHS repeat-associated protein